MRQCESCHVYLHPCDIRNSHHFAMLGKTLCENCAGEYDSIHDAFTREAIAVSAALVGDNAPAPERLTAEFEAWLLPLLKH